MPVAAKKFCRLTDSLSKHCLYYGIDANMHKVVSNALSWDDARILLAVMRSGTQATASKALGIDQATVSRRLLRLEDTVGCALFLRDGTRLIPTEAAQRLAERAEEAEVSLSSMMRPDPEVDGGGVVRIVAPSLLTSYLLAPALPLLSQLGRSVVTELIAKPEAEGLTHRDADVALRLTKPNNGGFLARRIASIDYRVYARRGANAEALPWIALDETAGELPEARWMSRHGGDNVLVRAADLPTIYQAVRTGIGKALLPSFLARRDSALVAVTTPEPPDRELWLLVQRRMRQIRHVALTLGWVEAVVRDAFPPCRA
jgi:DNA-binding transcriptional LysR family regulator